MSDRAKYIKLAVQNGVTDLSQIRDTYNTYSEGGYLDWIDKVKAWKPGIDKDIDSDNPSYDYKGFYMEDPQRAWNMIKGDPESHFVDTYKRPNHPTFSDESIYSTPDTPGGHWHENYGGSRRWVYEPSEYTKPRYEETRKALENSGEGYLNGMNIEFYKRYDDGGAMNVSKLSSITSGIKNIVRTIKSPVKSIQRYGWAYNPKTKIWSNTNGQSMGRSLYAKLSNGKRVHFNSDGTVSEVNQYGYVGKAASSDPSNEEGRRSLSQHIREEIKNQSLPNSERNYSSNQLKVKDELYNELIKAGFNRDQAQALVMNSADESEFRPEIEQSKGGAKGLFQFDKDERNEFENIYNNDWSIANQAKFLYDKMSEKAGKDTLALHKYKERLDREERIINGYFLPDSNTRKFVPTDSSYMEGRLLTDSIPIEDRLHRRKYAVKINQGYKNKEGKSRISGNTSRYTGLPLNHYIDIFMSANNGDYTPEELSFMFMAGYEKAGKPHSTRLDTSILK